MLVAFKPIMVRVRHRSWSPSFTVMSPIVQHFNVDSSSSWRYSSAFVPMAAVFMLTAPSSPVRPAMLVSMSTIRPDSGVVIVTVLPSSSVVSVVDASVSSASRRALAASCPSYAPDNRVYECSTVVASCVGLQQFLDQRLDRAAFSHETLEGGLRVRRFRQRCLRGGYRSSCRFRLLHRSPRRRP